MNVINIIVIAKGWDMGLDSVGRGAGGVAVTGENGESEGDVIHQSFDEIPAKRRRIVKGEKGRESWSEMGSGSSGVPELPENKTKEKDKGVFGWWTLRIPVKLQ
ncbi:hypothetical protein H5410_027298 [Solanum commersonii]|uniref:Uncharacterized protein n=1 Tax=Solanum commersonii TaxID=4109 RepID=A0A9J5Z422_SOLCO|nr:hypothetical protein H5410_027298 [Solanum commersonii]